MNRPENGILIVPRVNKMKGGSFTSIIRRLIFANGMLIKKDVLLPDGEWVAIPEGGKYPKECFLESHFFDKEEEDKKCIEMIEEWRLQETPEGWMQAAKRAMSISE